MALIFYGRKKVPVGVDEFFIKCPVCEAHQHADVMIESHYFHIYWIPVMPFDKTALIICQQCGLKRTDMEFSDRWFSNYHEIKSKFRHPWYTYVGITLVLLLIITLVSNIVSTSSSTHS